ncbi:acyl-CoA thioesterase [Myxococcota bacterium]|nr:acyl-CoA thioesterase [Myxococcota bacterium]
MDQATGSGWETATEVRTVFRDIDMLGHVNNAVYLSYLEQARTDLWRKWFGPGGYHRMPYLVGEATIRYRKAVHLDEVLRIDTRLAAVTRRTFTLEYRFVRVARSAGKAADPPEEVATARSVLVFFDPKTGRSVDAPAEFLDFAASRGLSPERDF